MRPHLACVVYVALGTAFLSAQDFAFEVASIRPAPQSTQTAEIRPTPWGRFTATNATVKSLVLRAYALVDAQLIGAPAWLNTERYDIDARAAAPPDGPEALMPMVRRLLVERFNLKAHTDMRELSAYALTVARRDSQLGSQIRPTNTDCSRATTLTQAEVRAAARDGWPPCGMAYTVSFVTTTPAGNNVKWRIRRSGVTTETLATALQQGSIAR